MKNMSVATPLLWKLNPDSSDRTISFGEKGSGAGMLSKPWGVAVNESHVMKL